MGKVPRQSVSDFWRKVKKRCKKGKKCKKVKKRCRKGRKCKKVMKMVIKIKVKKMVIDVKVIALPDVTAVTCFGA